MNKILSIAAIVALASVFSFSQGEKFGVRVALNGNSVTTGNGKEIDEDYGIGLGVGGGLAAVIPISGNFATRTGVELGYRTLYNMKLPGGGEQSASEFAISIPAMVQCEILRFFGFDSDSWLGVGVQLDLPFATKIDTDGNSFDFKDRSAVDFGIIIGGSYNFISGLALDIRGTIVGLALTNLFSENGDDSSLYQVSLGFTYLFD
ncbi:MAG: outer membrane beta-barrel protein [Fibromonadales bacterium]|nr:outer membrane beta-barrel protein [Fibromonadales bacterium]